MSTIKSCVVGNFVSKNGKIIFIRNPPSNSEYLNSYYIIKNTKSLYGKIEAMAITALKFLHIYPMFEKCLENYHNFLTPDLDQFLNLDGINEIVEHPEPNIFKLVLDEMYKKSIDVFLVNKYIFFLYIEFCISVYPKNISHIYFRDYAQKKVNEIMQESYMDALKVSRPESLFMNISHGFNEWKYCENYPIEYYKFCRQTIRFAHLNQKSYNLFYLINPSLMTNDQYEKLCMFGNLLSKVSKVDTKSMYDITEEKIMLGEFSNPFSRKHNALTDMFWRKMAIRYPDQFFPYPENIDRDITVSPAIDSNPWSYVSAIGHKKIDDPEEMKYDKLVVEKYPYSIVSLHTSRLTPQLWLIAINKKPLLQLFL